MKHHKWQPHITSGLNSVQQGIELSYVSMKTMDAWKCAHCHTVIYSDRKPRLKDCVQNRIQIDCDKQVVREIMKK